MLSETTLHHCKNALDALRKQNEADLDLVVRLSDGDLGNPVCVRLIARKNELQAAYGEVIRAIESATREKQKDEDVY